MKTKEKNKKALGMLIMLFPSLLIIATTNVAPLTLGWVLRLLLFGFQCVIVKNYLDEFYGEQ